MKKRENVFNYLSQLMTVFGFTVLFINLMCCIVGEDAQKISSIFQLGNQGIAVEIIFQIFIITCLMTALRFIFFSDVIFKNLSVKFRVSCILVCALIIIIIFNIFFNYFPNIWQCWASVCFCFIICFTCSYFMLKYKEKVENKQLQKALDKLKSEKK